MSDQDDPVAGRRACGGQRVGQVAADHDQRGAIPVGPGMCGHMSDVELGSGGRGHAEQIIKQIVVFGDDQRAVQRCLPEVREPHLPGWPVPAGTPNAALWTTGPRVRLACGQPLGEVPAGRLGESRGTRRPVDASWRIEEIQTDDHDQEALESVAVSEEAQKCPRKRE
ncbi:hypothetical protein ACFQX6_38990 [Streptosporangium lutulentum]